MKFIISLLLIATVVFSCNDKFVPNNSKENAYLKYSKKSRENVLFMCIPREDTIVKYNNLFYIKKREKEHLVFTIYSVDKNPQMMDRTSKELNAKKYRLNSTLIFKEYDFVKAIDFVLNNINNTNMILMSQNEESHFVMKTYLLKKKKVKSIE